MSSLKVKYARVGTGALGGERYIRMSKEIRKIINQEFSAVAEDGVGEAQGFISIAGTNREWSGWFTDRDGSRRDRSGRGRIHTGAMRDALTARVFAGEHSVGVDVGWINSDWEPYMSAQDKGFEHGGYRPDGTFVEGMGMFQHLRVYLRDKVSEASARVLDRVIDGL